MNFDVVTVINVIGVLAFSFTGAMRAINQRMDILGIIVLGIVYALGGGITRDVLVNRVPYALLSVLDMSTAIAGSGIAAVVYVVVQKDVSSRSYLLIPDALGLAAFTSTGALIAYQTDISGFGVVILATITAVGGGILGDLFLGKVPFVLRENFYASCCIFGAICFLVSIGIGLDVNRSSVVCSIATLLIRILAIRGQWRLPRISWSDNVTRV